MIGIWVRSVSTRHGLVIMRAGRHGRRLAGALITAVVTVATGIAINAAFVTDRSLILWPWFSAAVGLALVQVLLTRPEPEPPLVPNGANSSSGADTTIPSSEVSRRAELATYFRDLASQHVPLRPMPIAWKAVADARNRGAEGPIRVTGAEDIGEYLRHTPGHRLVILGGPGFGKTALAWHIAFDVAGSMAPLDLIPVVLPIGNWNPFETAFDDWLERQLSAIPELPPPGLAISEVLPILDGFDEYSTQLLSEALGILGNRKYASRPLVLLSRPNRDMTVSVWRDLLGNASVIELLPLPASEITSYIEAAPRSGDSPLDGIARALRKDPAGVAAQALSSPFMLDTAVKKYAYVSTGDFFARAETGSLAEAEDLLASHYLQWRVHGSYRWRNSNCQKWLREIARRASGPFLFRPNDLTIPNSITIALAIIAAALPAVAMIAIIPTLLLLLGLAIATVSGLVIFAGSDTRNEPTIDPRDEFRLERKRAMEKVIVALMSIAAMGFLGVLAPYTGKWVLGAGAAVGALVGVWGEPTARARLYVGAAGALCGPIFGWAAYLGYEVGSAWRFMIPGIVIGTFAFIVIFIGNMASHVSEGQGKEGLLTAPAVAAAAALPIGLLAGSVIAVANLSQLGFGVVFLDRLAGVVIFSSAVGCAILLVTPWTRILISRAYYAFRGIFPLRLLRFLEDFAELKILRSVGYSYEYKHPATLRAVKNGTAAPDTGHWM